jgi:hypothetical protein
MNLREAAQQALEALHEIAWCNDSRWQTDRAEIVIPALRDALEQQEQEPVANNPDPYHLSRILHELAGSASMCWEHVDRAGVFQSTQAADVVAAALAEIRQRMKDAPPRREWQSLSEDELTALGVIHSRYQEESLETGGWFDFARAVEAALKEKNNG